MALKDMSIKLALAVILGSGLMVSQAFAQASGKAFEGFSSNSKDPVQIEADELEVLDGQSKAVFRGNVKVRQGSSLITTSQLIVTYAKGGGGGQGDIEKLNLRGGLIVTSKDNTAEADKGTYNVKTEDVLLEGNVVVSQGGNIATGCKLTANLKTNKATLHSCPRTGGRVKSVFTPGSQKKKK